MSDSQGRTGSRLPTTIDTTKAHEARFYDYWLGGVDHYPADRALGDEIAAHVPSIRNMVRNNRAFLGRAVRYAITELGITQFLDIGTGLPTARNTHEVAQEVDPAARVTYVDKDPLVLAHARALMTSTPQGETAFIHANLHDPQSILTDPTLIKTIDLSRPVAITLTMILMYFRNSKDPQGVVAELLKAVPAGSTLTISHPTADFNPTATAQAVQACEHAGIPMAPRPRAEVEKLFAGTELVPPGVVTVDAWHPELAEKPLFEPDLHIGPSWIWAGMGRKL
jgi:hypothetical protein